MPPGQRANRKKDTSGVRKHIDIFSKDLLLVPINKQGNHWVLLVVDFRAETKGFYFYDSYRSSGDKEIALMRDYMHKESQQMRSMAWDDTGFEDHPCMEKTPRQKDGYNCGVFMLEAASCILNKRDLHFEKKHMPFLRKQLLVELKAGHLRGGEKQEVDINPAAALTMGDTARDLLDHHSTIYAIVIQFVDTASKPVTHEQVEAHLKNQEIQHIYTREWLHKVLQTHKPARYKVHYPRLDHISTLVATEVAQWRDESVSIAHIKRHLKCRDLHSDVDYESAWLKAEDERFLDAERDKDRGGDKE